MDYQTLVALYESLQATSKRLEKTYRISEFLKEAPPKDLPHLMLLIQGRLFPPYDTREIGVAARLAIKAIAQATGISSEDIEQEWKKTGDLGLVAETLSKKKRQATLFSTHLTTQKVFDNLRKLATLAGSGSVDVKLQYISELLGSATPSQAKYITRTMLGMMRIGVGEGCVRDAIVWAYFGKETGVGYLAEKNEVAIQNREQYNRYCAAVQHGYDMVSDFGHVAEIAKTKGLAGLKKMEIVLGVPLKVMLALKAKTIEEGFASVGKPAQIEFKYDGFRMQVHKKGDRIQLFTRRLEDVTLQFPDVAEVIKKNVGAADCIIDGEAVGFNPKTKKYVPFQNISQRIKRKYDVEKLIAELPIEFNAFDLLYYNGKTMLDVPFQQRRNTLLSIITPEEKKIVLATAMVSSEPLEVRKFFTAALEIGNEGVMFKSLDGPYTPGARVGFMVKYKEAQEGLDLVVVRAEWGEGRRSEWLSSFTVACIDEHDNFLEVGKVSTGLKEKPEEGLSFEEMTKLLRPLIIAESGKEVTVKPEIVIEVGYEEIQKSPTYGSGFALRFPRVTRLRPERDAIDSTTISMLEKLYGQQKK